MSFTPIKPATFSAALGTNAVITQYDLPPSEETMLRYETGDRKYFFDNILKMYGMRATATDKRYIAHAQIPRHHDTIVFDQITVAAGGAGGAMTVRLSATLMSPTSTNTIGGVATYGSPLRQWDTIIVTDAAGLPHVVRVEQKNAGALAQHTFVLRPVDGTVNLDTCITSGNLATNEYPIGAPMYPEGSNIGEQKVPRIRKYQNDHQIVKEAITFTGTEKTLSVYHTTPEGVSGDAVLVYVKPLQAEVWQRERSYALLHGERNTNSAIIYNNPELGVDTAVRGTQGFLPFAEAEGQLDTAAVFSTYSLDDFRRVEFQLAQSYVTTSDYLTLANDNILNKISASLLDKFTNTADRYIAAIYGTLQGASDKFNFADAAKFAVDINFKSVQVGVFNFTFRSLHELNDPKGLYALPRYRNYAIFMPVGTTPDGNDANKSLNLCGYSYRAAKNDSYSREVIVGSWAGLGAQTAMNVPVSSGWDIARSGMMCEIGFHGALGNHILIQRQ